MKKLVCSLGVVALTAVMVVALSSPPADAGPIGGPLCGWSALWECTKPNGKTKIVAGTQCDIAKIEARTGATCELL